MRPPARGRERFSRDPGNDRPLIMHENTTIRLRYEDFDAKSNFAGSSEQQMPPPPAGLILSGCAGYFSVRRKMKTSEAEPPPSKQLMPIVPRSDAPVPALVATRHYTAKGTSTWVTTNDRVVQSSDSRIVLCPADIPMSVAPKRE